ncbi:MAG TPA: VacJ family lipoprotein [Steroidobacteraceae bacterium]|nr:VacJ family lipoprotein [Steroidobacteraceae bacterium]
MRAALPGLCALIVSGCASQSVTIRSLPPERPAAENAAAIERLGQMKAAAAAARAHQPPPESPSEPPPQPITTADAPSMYTYDPWERMNRFTYRFNARFDEDVFLPAANGYRRIPAAVRSGVHHFFNNLSEVKTVVNYGLQLRPVNGLRSLGRFVINSTVGIGGLLDVATKCRLPFQPTGFSVTLAWWGMHPGPYLVIPLLGPSTLRDGVGYLGDYGIDYGVNPVNLYRGAPSYALGVTEAVDTRANTHFRYYSSASPFEYETVRFLYVRKELIEDEALHAWRHRKRQDATVPAGR